MVQGVIEEFMLVPATKPLNVDITEEDHRNKTAVYRVSCLTECVLQAREFDYIGISSLVSARTASILRGL